MADNSVYLDFTNIFPTIFRYIVIIFLYGMTFYYIQKPSLKFILYIVMFILNFFTFVFLYKDFFDTPLLKKAIFEQLSALEKPEFENWYTKFYVIIIFLTGGLFVSSLAIILTVFDYGKKTTNDYKSYSMTPSNKAILEKFENLYFIYIKYLAIFVYFIIFAHTTGSMKKIMFNMGSIILTSLMIITSVYSCVDSVRFFNVRKHKRQLYE
jgi:hypothetical protein